MQLIRFFADHKPSSIRKQDIIFRVPHLHIVTGDESVREDERSNDEEKDENVESNICQLSNQRTASQRRDKSCVPSH